MAAAHESIFLRSDGTRSFRRREHTTPEARDIRRDGAKSPPRLARVDTGRHRMTVVGFHRGGAAAQSCEKNDGAECGEKNVSHMIMLVSL